MIAAEDVDGTVVASIHLEWASTTIKMSLPWKGPAWSMCSLDHGRLGHSHGCSEAVGGDF